MLEEQRGFIHGVSPYLGCWFALQWTATSPGPGSQKSSGGWGHTGGEGVKKAAQPAKKNHVYYHYDPQGKFQSVITYTCINYIIIHVSYAAIFIYKYQSGHNVPDSGGTLTFDLLEVNTTYYLV